MKRVLSVLFLCVAVSVSAQKNYEIGNPNDEANYGYLKDYRPLKEYVDRAKYPNFKLGLAIAASDYLNGGNVKAVANNYFDEVVTGNAMKMGSCVNNNGVMNFTTVTNFVNAASAAGLNIYGHTLAWHAQQPNGWLNNLIADRQQMIIDPEGKTHWNVIAKKDFRTQQTVGWTGDQEKFGFSFKFSARDGMIVTTTKKTPNNYDVQYIAFDNIPCKKGETYKMTMYVRARNNPDGKNTGNITCKLGDWSSGPVVNVPFTETSQEVEVIFKNTIGNSFLLLQHGNFVGDIIIRDIRISHEDPGEIINVPLTAEEKHDTLVYAMDKWIKGMMNATNGKVKAWDLANETVSGADNDGDGIYDLQHGPSETDFFWQTHMGDLEYVRQACRLARKYYAEVMQKQGGDDGQLRLFINDYNLESDWDGNKKLKSLIEWIKRWEADGVTKIDGIGSQMHISCYMNENTQRNKKNAIENSFKLMAASGKLVRISELDMGIDDASGKAVPTDQVTEAMHKKMADLYEWIIKKYYEIIPVEQQWGICQWCATDSPASSGWRANTPVGLWTLDWYRKHTYAGFAKGLGANVTAIEAINEVNDGAPVVVYDLSGRPVGNSDSNLPAGLYIKNGKKFIVK
ncbi:MAG: endo-1,4-beta-xylanase [Bacteroidaceae bacterium]|nr:endo-1,4-beta-xylanase [Bacteroidaceae bacterium]